MESIIAVLIILCGLFSIVCAAKEYEFFMGSRKAQTLIRIIGVTGAKFFYITLGCVLVIVGVVILVHGVPPSAAS